jgi:DNA-directed RNA polymerase subunit RPC12/RpoP
MSCVITFYAAHWEHEIVPPGSLVCAECGHVYETALDLVDAHNRETGDLLRVHEADRIITCPECGHDF